MNSIPRSKSRGSRLLLLVGVILVAAVVSQCRMVTDSVTGPRGGAGLASGASCIQACADAAKAAMDAEQAIHQTNQKACGNDSACKNAEAARHQAAVAAITEQRRQCQAGCHHQGGGQGGR